ncbi:MAG: bifunctional glycoside hydrolase 114/ polysaccharide deacetylase family protein [Desulfuromonadaceae bacterium]
MTVQGYIRLVLLSAVLTLSGTAWGVSSPKSFSAALYYASNPPINELKAFDVVVVDPDSGLTPEAYGAGPSKLFAYISAGEADPNRNYTKQMNSKWFVGENKDWNSKVIDVSSPEWREFFLNKVVEPLWSAGYRGFFLDTMDSYQLSTDKSRLAAMESGLVETVRAIKARHPEARLILNRGFEIFPKVKDIVFAVAAESLYQNFSPATGKYGEVPPNDREWLTARLNEVKSAGVPVIAIDYVPPGKRHLARQTAEKIKALGFIPWVADKDLESLGVGAVEVMPRTVLGLYDGAEGNGDVYYSNLQRYAVMPLNYLGYTVKLHDLREPLPGGVLSGRYAGVVVWPHSSRSGEKRGLKDWTLRRVSEGVPVVFLDRFGVTLDAGYLSSLGLKMVPAEKIVPPIKVILKDQLIGFEQQPLPQTNDFMPIKLTAGKSLLQLLSRNGIVSDAAAITPWGGYVLSPYTITQIFGDQTAWVIDPFKFFKEALKLPEMPVPDTTTENGVRLLLSHVDGDGFESRAEWPGGKLAAEELRANILERYRIPTTISLITSSFAPNGINPGGGPQLEKIARGILALSNVEGASHSFSHPFRWKPDQTDSGTQVWPAVKIPGYSFSLGSEISGSLDYINQNLMPPGKRARIFQWTGNCVPGEEAVKMAYEAGALNINGGDTLITGSNRSLSDVAPLGISRGNSFQVFAPNQNENVYTNLWTGPFYGYKRVLETFRLTDSPMRLKPVNIYYHFYSATKEASLNALKQVHDWAVGQKLFAVYTSEYIEKVLDFNRTVIARDGSGWLIRNNGQLRQLRIPRTLGYPDLHNSNKVAGFNDHVDSRYLHLLPGGEALVTLAQSSPDEPYLASAGGFLDYFERYNNGLKLGLHGYTPFKVRIANAKGCRFPKGIKTVTSGNVNELVAELPEGKHALTVDCR